MTIRHNCKQSGCYIEHEMPDWGFLDGAFPRKIVPTDIDAFIDFRETGNLYIEFEEFAELHIMLSRNLEYAPAAEELTYTAETMTKDLMREGLCGKGPKTVNCECSQIRITPDMDTREAQQLYNKLINCKAHEAGNNTNINISPEEAARAYRKFNEQCLIFAGNKQKNG